MTKKSPTIIFFGSGPVAAASLAHLAEHFEIEAVITKPRAKGYHGSVPVLELAQQLGLAYYTPKNSLELDELMTTTHFQSPAGVVVDYGIIVSRQVINAFAKGIVNSHFSLLPQWRGADPITFAILSGQEQTGVSLMLIAEALDEGNLLAQEPFTIPPTMTTPELTTALVALSNQMLTKYLPEYLAGKIAPYPQPHDVAATYSRRLDKQKDGILDWHKPAVALEREVRAFRGWPQSRATFALASSQEFTVIVAQAAASSDASLAPGRAEVHKGHLLVGANNSALEILRLKVPGKKEITAAEFIRGYLKQLF